MTNSTTPVSQPPIQPRRQLLSARFEFNSPQKSGIVSGIGSRVQLQTPGKGSATQLQMLAEFKLRLERGEYRLVHQSCPCSAEHSSILVSEIDRYGLPLRSVLCLACGTVRIDPYLDSTSLESFYRELYQDLYGRAVEPASYFERQQAYGKKIRSVLFGNELPLDRKVLEIGCGGGGGLFEFQKSGFQVAGCDFSERLVTYGSQRGVRNLVVGGIAELRSKLPDTKFDFIFLHHVYEHVSEPIGLQRELCSVLAPAGRILIVVPDLSRIDQFPCPAGDALEFFHVAHKFNYSFCGLQAIANQAGFEAEQLHPPQKMRTVWSRSPELWARLVAVAQPIAPAVNSANGQQLWDYLQRTERNFQLGLCRAQLVERFRSLRPDRIISRWIRSLRRAA